MGTEREVVGKMHSMADFNCILAEGMPAWLKDDYRQEEEFSELARTMLFHYLVAIESSISVGSKGKKEDALSFRTVSKLYIGACRNVCNEEIRRKTAALQDAVDARKKLHEEANAHAKEAAEE